jgi:hypothetical protein
VILNDAQGKSAPTSIGGRATLDDLFRRAAIRRPDAVALIDPPNRNGFTDGRPRRLTYAEADRMISAIAGRLRRIGLRTDAIVGLQLANSVECVLALLGVMRAGMIAMPLPLLWRRADALAAFNRVGINALLVSGRIGQHDHFDLALQVAAEIFPIRYVCGFGDRVPDGVIPLDDLFAVRTLDPIPDFTHERSLPPGPGAHLAAVTWEVAANGLIPVGRSHAELIAGGLAVLLESRFEQDATILNTLTISSFAGLAIALVPWLLVGGTLVLHHPFDPSTFIVQQRSMEVDAAILPGPLVGQLVEAGCLPRGTGLARILGVWRAPDRLPRAPVWRDDETFLIDVQVFGETGLIPTRRGPGGRPGLTSFGVLAVPRGTKGGVIVGEMRPTAGGTIAMRGPMVPRCPFPPGIERTSLPQLRVSPNGFVDTGYACWNDRDNAPMVVTGPPPGMISVGGYRFVMRDLQDAIAEADASATLAALPDAIAGHRLAGSAPDRAAIQRILADRGANPLVINAFRDRRAAADRQASAN